MKKNLFKSIVVWIIVITGIIVFSIFTYIIGNNKGQLFGTFVIYRTQMKESSGIYVGTKVTIHGKITGNIVNVTILDNGEVELDFSVRKKHRFIITESSIVELKNSGALGDRYINIRTEDLSAPKLKKGSLIPYKKTSNLLSLFTGREDSKSLQSLKDIFGSVNDLLDRLNKEGLKGVLSKSDQKELSQLLKHTNSVVRKIDSGEGTLGALINDKSLYNRALILLGERPKKGYLQDLTNRSKKTQ
ncbi:MAG: MlaD family protein [Bdellovibrionaceae bacterium]|nr:MlaD family protein [Pseudobdellovibrionaceae bacterium]